MGHQDKGHYANKHQGVEKDQAICTLLENDRDENTITCASAHKIAKSLRISPAQVGVQADLMELGICQCQMGLFGYGPGIKKLDLAYKLDGPTDAALESAARDGRISCADAWNLARELKCSRLEMGSACEAKGLRIKPCQLGAF